MAENNYKKLIHFNKWVDYFICRQHYFDYDEWTHKHYIKCKAKGIDIQDADSYSVLSKYFGVELTKKEFNTIMACLEENDRCAFDVNERDCEEVLLNCIVDNNLPLLTQEEMLEVI
jgi:hypothetical protein